MPFGDKNKPKEPTWLSELYEQLNGLNFISDDEVVCKEPSAEYCLADRDTAFEMLSLPSDVEDLDEEDGFAAELAKLIRTKWTATKRDLCARALLLENTFYKIQAGRRLPGRDTIICLSLALQLEPHETLRLLGYLGYGLGEHIKRDYIILRCLELKKAPQDVNLLLDRCGLRLLGPND